jgi:hypothetical protein
MFTMRMALVMLVLLLSLGLEVCHRAKPATLSRSREAFASSPLASNPKKPDFQTEIKPIFQARCQPCHFQGGKVYDHLPFDRPETITRLGEKLFTRIKDKEEQRLIREFLAP